MYAPGDNMKHFLENDTFGLYTACVYYDWQQARDEGRDVAHLKEVCREIQKRFYSDNRQDTLNDLEVACALEREMRNAPVTEKFEYVEPSDYKKILKERSKKGRAIFSVSEEAVKKRILGGWTGRVVGCLLGKPLEFWKCKDLIGMLKETENYPVNRYVSTKDFTPDIIKKYNIKTGTPLIKQPWIDELKGYAPADDDTNYTVLNLKLMEVFGYDFDPGDVLYAWINWVPAGICCTAERIAYKNVLKGLSAPATATFQNPYREWVGAQIRAEVFGWVNPGSTEAAAEAAFRDACVSHTRNGIYGEMFTAARIAAAMHVNDVREIIEAGLGEIPENSRLAMAVRSVIAEYDSGMTLEQSMEKLHSQHNENNIFEWCHIIPNEKVVILSLLHSGGDFTRAIGNCVQFAFDTDSNAAVVGAVMGTLLGLEGIEEKWTTPIGGIMGSTVLDEHMNRIEDLAERTFKVAKREIAPDYRLKDRYNYNESFTID
jgi:ADP-ribosylglycohydrolase